MKNPKELVKVSTVQQTEEGERRRVFLRREERVKPPTLHSLGPNRLAPHWSSEFVWPDVGYPNEVVIGCNEFHDTEKEAYKDLAGELRELRKAIDEALEWIDKTN